MLDKRFAECVFDLTVTACEQIRTMGIEGYGIDSRALFDEIYSLAAEFELKGGDDGGSYLSEIRGSYMSEIEDFGERRLRRYFEKIRMEAIG